MADRGIRYQGKTYIPSDPHSITRLLTDLGDRNLDEVVASGAIQLTGNQTWGSGSYVFGSGLKASDAEKIQILVAVLREILYDEAKPLSERLRDALREWNGLGMNCITGILNALYPQDHVLYNEISVSVLEQLGLADAWPSDWRRREDSYFKYRELCLELCSHFHFEDLADLDWFVYLIAKGAIPLDKPVSIAHPAVIREMRHAVDTALLRWGVLHIPSGWHDLLVPYRVDQIEDVTITLPSGHRITGARIRPYALGRHTAFRLSARRQEQKALLQSLERGQELLWRFLFYPNKVEVQAIGPKPADVTPTIGDQLIAFTLGLILGKGEIRASTNCVVVHLQYGPYKNGQIVGGDVSYDEREVLPQGAAQLAAQLERMRLLDVGLIGVNLVRHSLYRYDLVLEFDPQSELLRTIRQWFPSGTSYADFRFPISMLRTVPVTFAREFARGYACATGLITDATRAGPSGRHRVFLRAAANNKEILNDLRRLLETKLNVPVAHIFWHEGRDPQMRIWAEDFAAIGFGIDWMDTILKACVSQNRSMRAALI